MIEPGRSLVGNAGVLLTEALYLKPGDHTNFCVVDVAMNDLKKETVEKARALIERNMSRQVSRSLITEAEMQAALLRIRYAADFESIGEQDLVIEAATEDETVKRKIFADLCPKLKPGAVLASNTSSISITRLASTTDRPERFIGMHFMNPVPMMQLVELIRGIATADETFVVARNFVESLGKVFGGVILRR